MHPTKLTAEKQTANTPHIANMPWMRLGIAASFLAALMLSVTLGLFGQIVPAQAGSLAQRETDIPDLTVEKNVLAEARPIQVGDVITYTVRLHNEAMEERTFGLWEIFISPLSLAGSVELEVLAQEISTRRVNVQTSRLENGGTQTEISWRGDMEPNAEFELRIPVQVQVACRPGMEQIRRVSEVTVREFDGRETLGTTVAAEEFMVACPQPQVSLGDVEVLLEVVGGSDTLGQEPMRTSRTGQAANPTEELFGAYNFLLTRAHLTNNADEQVVVGYRLENNFIGETEKNVNGRAGAERHDDYYTPIVVRAGATQAVEIWTDMRPIYREKGLILDSLDFGSSGVDYLQGAFDFHYLLLPAVQAREPQVLPPADADIQTVAHNIRVRGWDLGDAPDSSTHAVGVTMDAYPGVMASFPTVYNPAVSSNPGPAHTRPRYFHLGRSVSLEIDADLGVAPNINPATGAADMDLYDDGVFPSDWNLVHCATTTIDVRVNITPQALAWFTQADRPGYLNTWIDSNRDGRWGYVGQCDEGPALEHFIIDYPIDVVALGAGYHTLRIPTGRIYWPPERAEDPAWVRVMLSERPSEKVGNVDNIQHGDGRGPSRPYLLGETEDYLLRPAGSAGSGPDMELRITGDWRPLIERTTLDRSGLGSNVIQPAAQDAADFTFQKIELALVANFANRGTETAEDVQLTFEFPEGVTRQEILETVELGLVAPRRDAQTIYLRLPLLGDEVYPLVEDNKIIVELNSVPAGARGQLMLWFRPELGDEVIVDTVRSWIFKAEVFAARDIRNDNTTSQFKVEIEGVTQGAFEFRAPDSPFWVQEGTTNSRSLSFQGFIPTGETAIFLDAQGNLVADRIRDRGYVNIWVHSLLDAARTDMDPDEARIAVEYLAPGVYIEEVSFRSDGKFELELENLADGFYQVAVGHPDACNQQASNLAGNDNEWRYSPFGLGFGCNRFVVDSSLYLNPVSLGFVEVPADAAQMVVSEDADGKPKVNGRYFLPNTLNWAQEGWNLRLPVSQPNTDYVAVFSLRKELLDSEIEAVTLIDQFGVESTNVAAVETAIPALYASEPFFFDEADALFGKRTAHSAEAASDSIVETAPLLIRELIVRIETETKQLSYAGRRTVPEVGRIGEQTGQNTIQPLNPDAEPQNGLVYLLAPTYAGGKAFFDMYDGVTEYGQPNPVSLDAEGRFSLTVPRGIYQLWVDVPGYQPYRTQQFSADGVLEGMLPLLPAPTGEPNKVIVLDQDGMTQPPTGLQPGDLIQFVSMDDIPRVIQVEGPLDEDWISFAPQVEAAGQSSVAQNDSRSVRSPELQLGESFMVRVGETGELHVQDVLNPGFGGMIRVTEEPTEPEEPVDPEDPEEPGDPQEPVDPEDPEEPGDPETPGDEGAQSLFLPQLSR